MLFRSPYVARLIQAHADVVNLFVKNGFGEPHKNHAIPSRDDVAAVSAELDIPIPTSSEPAAGCCKAAASETKATSGCANAGTCSAEGKGCSAGKCATCPNATKGCAAGEGCNVAASKCATCPNATKCAEADKGCAAGKCATCPLSDACPDAKKE